jgi:hypothetical protein
MSKPEKLGDVGARLLKWATENSDELDRRSAEYDRQQTERREREKAATDSYLERIRGLPLSQHPNVSPEPWGPGLLHGPAGVGKTRRAVARLLSVPKNEGVFIDFMEFLELARKLEFDRSPDRKSEFERMSDFDRERWDAVFRRRYLVLDDFGARRRTDFAADCALQLLKARIPDEDVTTAIAPARYETLLTSNLTLQGIHEQWDERIRSRIAGLGPARWIEGPDWRMKSAARHQNRKSQQFLRIAPQTDSDEEPGEPISQSEVLSDLEPGRPRNGGAA